MAEEDSPEPGSHRSAIGILQCLTSLAEEAQNLGLMRTNMALRKAIRACQAEQAHPHPNPRPRRHLVVH